MISKIARHGSPVEHQAWRDVVDDFDNTLTFMAESEEEEAAVDMWLENPQAFMGTDIADGTSRIASSGVRRPQTGGMGLRRADAPRPKTASASDWDQEFADAKAHVASVLKQLGSA